MNIRNKINNYKFLFSLCNTLDYVFQYKYISFLSTSNIYQLCVDSLFAVGTDTSEVIIVFTHSIEKKLSNKLKETYKHIYVVCHKKNAFIDLYQCNISARDFRHINTKNNELILLHKLYSKIFKYHTVSFMMSNKIYTYTVNTDKYRIIGTNDFMYIVLSMFVYKFLSQLMLNTFSNYKNAKQDVSGQLKKTIKIYKVIRYSKC